MCRVIANAACGSWAFTAREDIALPNDSGVLRRLDLDTELLPSGKAKTFPLNRIDMGSGTPYYGHLAPTFTCQERGNRAAEPARSHNHQFLHGQPLRFPGCRAIASGFPGTP